MLKKIAFATLVLTLLIVGVVPAAFAVVACPDPVSYTQPDGTIIQVHTKGDQFLGWHEDEEGNLIVFDIYQEGFCYATWTDGGPVPMGELVGSFESNLIPMPRTKGDEIPQEILDQAEQARSEELAWLTDDGFMLSDLIPGIDLPDDGPPLFNNVANLQRKVLIIHVTWQNRAGINTPKLNGSQIHNLVFNPNSNSVNKYYKELLGTTTDIILPATVSSPLNGNQGIIEITLPGTHTNSQGNGNLGDTVLANAIITACSNGLINLAAFDTNGNGALETTELAIGFIVDGYETSAGAPAPSFWAMSTVNTPIASSTNGVKIQSYFGQGAFHGASGNSNADMLTVGTICHELGHSAYKFVDTYDYGTLTGTSKSNGHGLWSLMSQGSWANKAGQYPGASPGYPDAYNLVKSGFVTPGVSTDYANTTLNSPLGIYLMNTPDPKQFFLLQLRKYGSADNFDRGAFYRMNISANTSHGGLLIYHIDENVTLGRINDKPGHYRAAIEEAHGGTQHLQQRGGVNYGGIDDLWGGSKTAFSLGSDPSSGLYSAFIGALTPLPSQTTASGINLSNITWNSGTGTVTFSTPAGSYIVAYNYSENGGSSATVASAAVNTGSAINLSPTAAKSGWTFVGWNTNKDATSGLASLTMGTSNVVLYAIFKRDLTATFIDYSGTTKQTRTQTATIYNKAIGASIQAPALATYTGWTSRGWGTGTTANASIAVASNATFNLSATTTFYGLYSRILTITYDANGGSPKPPNQTGTQYVNSYAITTFANPTVVVAGEISKSGTQFRWWKNSSGYGANYISAIADLSFNENLTLSAVWGLPPSIVMVLKAGKNTRNDFMIYLDAQQFYFFTAPVSGTYRIYTSERDYNSYGGFILEAYLEQKIGTSFKFLNYDEEGVSKPLSITHDLIAGEMYMIYLRNRYYNAGNYTINIYVPPVNWGLAAGNNIQNGVIHEQKEEHMYEFIAPTSGTYNFSTTNKASTLTWLDGYLYDSSENYLASQLDGGSGINFSHNLQAGQTYYLKLEGYSGSGAYTINTTVPAANAYTVTYNYSENGGTSASLATATVAAGAVVNLTPTAIKPGWTFMGWNTDKNANAGLNYLVMGTANITLYAIFKAPEINWVMKAGTNSKNGFINLAKEQHTYKFIAPVSGVYTFSTTNKASALTYLDPYLYNSTGSLLYSFLENGNGFTFNYSLTAGQTYYLKLDAYSGTGAYTINIKVPAIDWTLAAGSNSKTGVINEEKEEHMYKFTAPATGTYTFSTSGKASTLIWLDGFLYNSADILLLSQLDDGNGINFSYNLTAGQIYYLKLEGYWGKGAYTITIKRP
ncbi:MAG: InlB B-repeat-containing protein [Clostridiales bacterium]|nr:InlB B-repeat-containing protein [Clostridiales bacterium]